MRFDAVYRIVGGIALVIFSLAVPIVKFRGWRAIVGGMSADWRLAVGCAAIALLGILVAAAGARALKKFNAMTAVIRRMVEEKNRIVTKDIAGAVGVDETDVREHVDEMIAKREIPVGTKITYVGGEKVVK